jgi:hypothetical protein
MEGSSHSLIRGTIPAFVWKDERKLSGYLISEPRFGYRIFFKEKCGGYLDLRESAG